jgi:hypothetical protein
MLLVVLQVLFLMLFVLHAGNASNHVAVLNVFFLIVYKRKKRNVVCIKICNFI